MPLQQRPVSGEELGPVHDDERVYLPVPREPLPVSGIAQAFRTEDRWRKTEMAAIAAALRTKLSASRTFPVRRGVFIHAR